MGKARRDKYGNTLEQSLIKENQALKRQIQSLRKTIARLDLDRYPIIKELIQENYKEDRAEEGKEILENLKKSWACKECDGYLEICIWNRGKDTIYYRVCSNSPRCGNRTKTQIYSKSVKGIMRRIDE